MLRMLNKSLKYKAKNRMPSSGKCIYMFWHRNLLILALHRMEESIAVVISPSLDGELIAGPVTELGYIPVRGSSSKQGSKALRQMIELSKEHQLAITPDGPKGPPKRIHPGVIQIAYFAKVPIIPVVADASREWVFSSWDKFRVPKPFAKIKVIYGEPVFVTDKYDFEQVKTLLKRQMEELEQELKSF